MNLRLMNTKTKFNLWYVFLAIWGVIVIHEARVRMTLAANAGSLHNAAELLLPRETISGDELKAIRSASLNGGPRANGVVATLLTGDR